MKNRCNAQLDPDLWDPVINEITRFARDHPIEARGEVYEHLAFVLSRQLRLGRKETSCNRG